MRRSLAFSRSSSASRVGSSATTSSSGTANGDSGEGLVDVRAIELLSVGVEADHLLASEKSGNLLRGAVTLHLHSPQKAVAAQGQQGFAETLLKAFEKLFQVGHQRAGAHGGQYDAV